jgi:hypothetical protein
MSDFRLKSSALALGLAVMGGAVLNGAMSDDPFVDSPQSVIDIASKAVAIEMVIGATDGLKSTGWSFIDRDREVRIDGLSLDSRIDRLRIDPKREEFADLEAYREIRETAFDQAIGGKWSEEAISGYVDAIEGYGPDVHDVMRKLYAKEDFPSIPSFEEIHLTVKSTLSFSEEPLSTSAYTLAMTKLTTIEMHTNSILSRMTVEELTSAPRPIVVEAAYAIGLDTFAEGFPPPAPIREKVEIRRAPASMVPDAQMPKIVIDLIGEIEDNNLDM